MKGVNLQKDKRNNHCNSIYCKQICNSKQTYKYQIIDAD